MASPVFVVCQGRTGGTMLYELLLNLPGTHGYLEPFVPMAMSKIEQRPESRPLNRHYGITDPWRGYDHIPMADLRRFMVTRTAKPERIHAALDELIRRTPGEAQPVFKLANLWGKLELLRSWYPDAVIVRHWRTYKGRRESARRVRLGVNDKGEATAYGSQDWRKLYDKANREARSVADVSVCFDELMAGRERAVAQLRPVLCAILGAEDLSVGVWSQRLYNTMERRRNGRPVGGC